MYCTEQHSYPQELIIQTICLKTIFQANISDAEEEKAHSCQSSRRASRMLNSKAVCLTAFAGTAKVRALWVGKHWKRLSEAHKVRLQHPQQGLHFISTKVLMLASPHQIMFYQNGEITFLLPQQWNEGWWESIKHWLFEKEERKTRKEKMILSCTEDLHLIIRANAKAETPVLWPPHAKV